MTIKMLFLIALMAPILLIAMGALIHGPGHAPQRPNRTSS